MKTKYKYIEFIKIGDTGKTIKWKCLNKHSYEYMKEKPIIFSTGMIKAILDDKQTMTRRIIKVQHPKCVADFLDKCPYQIGQILWVRETWCYGEYIEEGEIWYKAHDSDLECFNEVNDRKWRPSIFMPRWAARIFLKITNIRVERLQDIAVKDCIKEGIERYDKRFSDITIKMRFRRLWDSINKKRGYGWETNPWVWVIEFERTEGSVQLWANS